MPIETQPKTAKAKPPGKGYEQALPQRQWQPADFRKYGDEQSRQQNRHTEKLNRDAVKQLVARGHDLIQMNLYGLNLEKTMLAYVDCMGADLRRANLSCADLTGARLLATKLEGAQLQRSNLQEAVLCGAQLRAATLQQADLRRANLRWCNLRDADLAGANLQAANLAWADLRDANLQGATLIDALYNHTTQWPEGFNPAAAGCISVGNSW